MKMTHMRQKLMVTALAGAIMIPGNVMQANAADAAQAVAPIVPVTGIEAVLTECYETEVKENINLYLVPTDEGEYLNMAFSNVEDYTYIRTAPDETSDWLGKLYKDSAATVLEYTGDWAKIQSGSAEGYVPMSTLFTGDEAKSHEEEYKNTQATVTATVLNVRDGQGTSANILTQILETQQYTVTGEAVNGWYPVKVGEIDGWVCGDYVEVESQYSYGETKEEEEERIAREEAAKQAAEAAKQNQTTDTSEAVQNASVTGTTGQAVIDYACQFIGNPYVWGGTSLTNGADCSGFVQSVYAHFGISLPRTTWDMENVGYAVTYDQAQPGDLVLYDGHVGLYMGDGNIVNAMNEVDGIGICPATYTPILTIRRVL